MRRSTYLEKASHSCIQRAERCFLCSSSVWPTVDTSPARLNRSRALLNLGGGLSPGLKKTAECPRDTAELSLMREVFFGGARLRAGLEVS